MKEKDQGCKSEERINDASDRHPTDSFWHIAAQRFFFPRNLEGQKDPMEGQSGLLKGG